MIRYKKLGYVAFNVTDLGRSASFYHDMVGLDLTEHVADHSAFLSCSDEHHCVALYSAATPGLKRIAYEVEDRRQLEQARATLERANVSWQQLDPHECAALKVGEAIRFSDNNGIQIELYADMLKRPGTIGTYPTEIKRIDHVVLIVPDVRATIQFYGDVLNFQPSDFRERQKTGETYFAYMRCFPNPNHHSFAFVEGATLKYFHTALAVAGLDGLMRGRNRLLKTGVPVEATPGRHLASGGVFQYFSDPDGLTLEFTFGGEQIPEHAPRAPRKLDDSARTGDIWEGDRSASLRHVGTIEFANP